MSRLPETTSLIAAGGKREMRVILIQYWGLAFDHYELAMAGNSRFRPGTGREW